MEEIRHFIRIQFIQFIEEEQTHQGLSDHDRVGDYEIDFLKKQGTDLPAFIFIRTMAQFSPHFAEWFMEFDQQLKQFKQNKEEAKND